MRSPLLCALCGDTQVGWHFEYEWGPNGCDPPENEVWNEEHLIDNEWAVCDDCFEATADGPDADEEKAEDEE